MYVGALVVVFALMAGADCRLALIKLEFLATLSGYYRRVLPLLLPAACCGQPKFDEGSRTASRILLIINYLTPLCRGIIFI